MPSTWLTAWLGAAGIGVANGIAREVTYGRLVSERTANQISGGTAIAAFGLYFAALQRRWPLRDTGEALGVGAAWVAMTVSFEFGFGRLVARQSWDELLADYDVREGRTWPLVLAWIAVGPAIIAASRPAPNTAGTNPTAA
jgi:hypothetical protein